jgi:NOL1/NOP2/fmu family ribosome biogenesis protein
MFRKNDRAIEEWSLSNVALSAARQKEILKNGAACVAPGGYLLYSTCTYSIEENEQNVADFLSAHPEFSLVPCKESVVRHTADGISDGIDTDADLTLCRRFYPHLTPGEGQFIALFRRDPDAPVRKPEKARDKSHRQPAGTGFASPAKADLDAANAFLSETIGKTLPGIGFRGGNLILMPVLAVNPLPTLPTGTVALGTAIGEARKGRIVPHHHFFMAYGKEMKNQLVLDPSDERVTRYLAGEEIDIPSERSGFTAVLLRVGETAVTLGGGKASGGRLKNYYPKGLRTHP